MKVLILSNSVDGLYNFRRELVQELLINRYNVIISAPAHEKLAFFKELGCECITTPINRRGINPLTDLILLIKYILMLKNLKPNIVLTYTIKPNVYGGISCRLLKIPFITNITGLGSAVENKGLLHLLTLFLYKIVLSKARCVFFQNEENRRFFVNRNIAVENNRILPGSGVNLNYYHYMDYPSDEKIRFLFVGRVLKEKGIEYYFEAADYFKKNYSNIEFHIVGNCEEVNYFDKLKDMESKSIIKYHGRQDDVRGYYKMCHCIIHPTYYPEGMSNVLLESAACGRPIIATNRAGCREIVDNGINGYLVKPKDSVGLIKKMEKFIKLPHNKKKIMGLAGRKKVENNFDRNIVVKTYLEEIQKITKS